MTQEITRIEVKKGIDWKAILIWITIALGIAVIFLAIFFDGGVR